MLGSQTPTPQLLRSSRWLTLASKGSPQQGDQTSNPTDIPLELKGNSVAMPSLWKLSLGGGSGNTASPTLLEDKPSKSCHSFPSSKTSWLSLPSGAKNRTN